jgi:1,4-dihydroxy-2-naphthoate octaprenyltransferase
MNNAGKEEKEMSQGKSIVMLLRLPFLTVTIGGVLLGTAYGYFDKGQFHLMNFVLALLGACFFHIATNVANDYFDFRSGNDAANISGTSPFSGGSRILLDGQVSSRKALAVSLIFAALGSAIGLYLNFTTPGNWVLLFGVAGFILIYSYNGFPLRLVNKGLGEIAIFTAWGPLIVLGAYYVQAQALTSWWPFIVSIPSGILTTLVLLINEFADRDADESTGRKTWVILFGNRAALVIYLLLAYACSGVVLAGVLLDRFPLWSLIVGLTLLMPLQAYRIGSKSLGDWGAFMGAVKSTILLNIVFLVLLSVSFFI